MKGSSWKILACALAWSVTLCAGKVRSACQDGGHSLGAGQTRGVQYSDPADATCWR